VAPVPASPDGIAASLNAVDAGAVQGEQICDAVRAGWLT